jgi:hypothetical protein
VTHPNQDIINKFHVFLGSVDRKSIIVDNVHSYPTKKYSMPYNKNVAAFMESVSGVSSRFIQQYCFLNQLNYLLSDYDELDILFDFIICTDSIWMELREPESKVLTFLEFGIHSDNTLSIVYNNEGESTSECFTLEDAYAELLLKIKDYLDPSLITFNDILVRQKEPTFDFINKRLNKFGTKLLKYSDYCHYENAAALYKSDFMQFIKSSFSIEHYHKMNQLVSLSSFQIPLHKFKFEDLYYIRVPDLSKYKKNNIVYLLTFGILPHDGGRFTIYVMDNGDFIFAHRTEHSSGVLNDLDSIYNYINDQMFLKIAMRLDIEPADITFKHFDLYNMVLL